MSGSERAIDLRVVEGPWMRIFVLATVLALAVLGSWELHWRRDGIRGSISDVAGSWGRVRDRMRGDSMALLGTSKMQSAIDPRVLGRALERQPPAQLALIDSSPLLLLEHLASDRSYHGTVIVDIAPRIFFETTRGQERTPEAILRAYRRQLVSPGERIDVRLTLRVEEALALRRPAFSLRRLVERWLVGTPLKIPYARVRLDRFRELYFDRHDLESRIAIQARIAALGGRALDAQGIEALIGRTAEAAAAIRERGGEVVLVSLPISGELKELTDERFPREKYWDALVSGSGLLGIHWEDHPELARFECPDGIHLDRQDASAFTEAFARVLESATLATR